MAINSDDWCSFGAVTLGTTDSYGVDLVFTGIDGLGSPQSSMTVTQKAAADGGFASPAFLAPRSFTVSVSLVADDRPSLIAAMDRVSGAASIAVQKVTVSIGGATRYAWAQRQGEVVWSFLAEGAVSGQIQFAAADPRWLAADLSTYTGLPSSSGGLTVPFTVPFAINSNVVTGQVALTNPGNATGPVKMRIDGPVTGPQITHVGSGATLVFASNYTLASGAWLTVDMDAHTVLENDQATRANYVTLRGWSGFEPGNNLWTFSAASVTAARLTVVATPAWT